MFKEIFSRFSLRKGGIRLVWDRNKYCQLAHKVENDLKIISCKRNALDHYFHQKYGKFDEIPLASKGWLDKKSRGDYFVVNPHTWHDSVCSNTSFSDLNIHPVLIENLGKTGIFGPTDIQAKAIPCVAAGKNTLIAAETGCGKTLSYLLPILDILLKSYQNEQTGFNTPLCLVLTPGRELAMQIGRVCEMLLENTALKSHVIIGGRTKRKIMNPEFYQTDVLVATPGAISKLTTNRIYHMHKTRFVVLDEADSLLDDSFSEKMFYFLKKFKLQYNPTGPTSLKEGTQLILVSATMPKQLPDTLQDIIVPESLVHVSSEHLHRIAPHVPQKFFRLGRAMKPMALLKLVKTATSRKNPVMIFSNKTPTCDWVSMFLRENGVDCLNLNGDMPFVLRQDKFEQFQSGLVNVISCTDIGSRGLDTTNVKHVINYDFPVFTADYIHRCGRTGRIGSPENCLITNFISSEREVNLVMKIEMAIRRGNPMPSVDGNITRIIQNRINQSMGESA